MSKSRTRLLLKLQCSPATGPTASNVVGLKVQDIIHLEFVEHQKFVASMVARFDRVTRVLMSLSSFNNIVIIVSVKAGTTFFHHAMQTKSYILLHCIYIYIYTLYYYYTTLLAVLLVAQNFGLWF